MEKPTQRLKRRRKIIGDDSRVDKDSWKSRPGDENGDDMIPPKYVGDENADATIAGN